MKPKLYMMEESPPVRSILLTTRALDIELDLIPINLAKGEHLSVEYQQLNPQHTIPTLDDNGKIIWDSHAINPYLIASYSQNDTLYPQEPYIRALINQRLHFDSSVLFPCLRNTMPIINEATEVEEEMIQATKEGYAIMETFLEGHQWAVGDEVTLADLTLLPTITTLDVFVSLTLEEHPNIMAWIRRAEETLPYYEANETGLNIVRKNFIEQGFSARPYY